MGALERGIALFNAGRFADALRAFEGCSGERARLFAAHCLRALGRPAEAEGLLSGRAKELAALRAADQRGAFRALAAAGRYREAFEIAESMLDRGAAALDLRTFWHPWPQQDLGRARARHLSALRKLPQRSPWPRFYASVLAGAARPLALRDERRYGWMRARLGHLRLLRLDFAGARTELGRAARAKPSDWRARGFLAETHLALKREKSALREIARAFREAPAQEKGEALAWAGALDLWRGDYRGAEKKLRQASTMGASWAPGWLGGALVKLGRLVEARRVLDEALRARPLDHEARLWRAEALRRLGRPKAALADLAAIPKPDDWVRANAGLAYEALGDRRGLARELAKITPALLRAVGPTARPLEALLERSRGYRRADVYGNAFWLPRRGSSADGAKAARQTF